MKIKKLEKINGKYEVEQFADKINEIIDLLNNSFITQDADIATVDCLATLSTDRLVPYPNETTILNLQQSIQTEPKGLFDDISCPKCGEKYFEIGPSECTAVYYPIILKDGKNINPDHNTHTTHFFCQACGHTWTEET